MVAGSKFPCLYINDILKFSINFIFQSHFIGVLTYVSYIVLPTFIAVNWKYTLPNLKRTMKQYPGIIIPTIQPASSKPDNVEDSHMKGNGHEQRYLNRSRIRVTEYNYIAYLHFLVWVCSFLAVFYGIWSTFW